MVFHKKILEMLLIAGMFLFHQESVSQEIFSGKRNSALKDEIRKKHAQKKKKRVQKFFENINAEENDNTISSPHIASDSATVAWERHYASQTLSTYDGAREVNVDNEGNIVVAGFTESYATGRDVLLIKYNAAGTKLWEVRYDNPEHLDDVFSSFALDANGNIYVCGSSFRNGTMYNMMTIKYNSLGVQQWFTSYNSTENVNDYSRDIAIDTEGNVIVYGYSSIGLTRFVLIKYNASGAEQWTQFFSDNEYIIEAKNIAVDGSNNIFLSGESEVSDTTDGILIVKYNSQGVFQWQKKYTSGGGFNVANAMVADVAGNVYITGESIEDAAEPEWYEFSTVKFSSAGNLQWEKRYSGTSNSDNYPNDIKVDNAGNVYVAGESYLASGEINCVTIKYSTTGTQRWAKRFSTDINSWGNAVLVDSSGNVFVGGGAEGNTSTDFFVVKYSSTGNEQWYSNFNVSTLNDELKSFTLDDVGNIYGTGYTVVGYTPSDFITAKLDNEGNSQWTAVFHGTGNTYDEGNAITDDNDGNIVVSGFSKMDTSQNIVTQKYSSAGNEIWTSKYLGTRSTSYTIAKLIHDNVGNNYIFATKFKNEVIAYPDFFLLKINSSGVEQWTKTYSRTNNSIETAKALAVDNTGNVYITGESKINTSSNFTTIKYNASGMQLWEKHYNATGTSVNFPNDIAVDDSGNVFVAGGSNDSSSSDFATIKYDTDGNLQWVARYNSFRRIKDVAYALALDNSGNVYVTGESGESYMTIKYNSTGEELWNANYYYSGTSRDIPQRIALDSENNIYVTGAGYANSKYYTTTIKYNSSGDQLWLVHDTITSYPLQLQLDNGGNVYLGCTRKKANETNDFYIRKYSTSGNDIWETYYNEPRNASDKFYDMIVDNAGNIFAVGTSAKNNWSISTLVKWEQTPASVNEMNAHSVKNFSLYQNYPNPFNPKTTIRFTLSTAALVTMKVYNIIAQEVATLIHERKMDAGKHEVEFDASRFPSGVYFYQLDISQNGILFYRNTKKLLLVK